MTCRAVHGRTSNCANLVTPEANINGLRVRGLHVTGKKAVLTHPPNRRLQGSFLLLLLLLFGRDTFHFVFVLRA